MRRTATACGVLAFTSALALALAVPTVPTSSTGAAFAQNKAATGEPAQPTPNTTTTTVSDNTYGEGGTKTTLSDSTTFTLQAEQYKDKSGTVREARLYEGELWVFLYDDMGKFVVSYIARPVDPNNSNGQWSIVTNVGGKKTETQVMDKATAEERVAAASATFAKSGGLEPYVETKIEPPAPKSGGPEPYLDTKIEPPLLGTPKPPSASGGQTGAPKTCGEITDQAMLIAMGCTPAPATRAATTVNRSPAPVPTSTSTRSQDDCIGNRQCEEELIRRAAERDGSSARLPPSSSRPGGPIPGGNMPGSVPSLPVR